MGDTKMSSPILITTYFETKLDIRQITLILGLLHCSQLPFCYASNLTSFHIDFLKKITPQHDNFANIDDYQKKRHNLALMDVLNTL